MRHVLTLVAPALTPSAPTDAAEILRSVGATVGTPEDLDPGHAVDVPCDLPRPAAELADALATALDAALPGIDRALQLSAGRRKRLLIADMESTVIRNEMLDELADHLGFGPKVAEITARAMNGELGFREALDERVALFRGQPESLLDDVRNRIEIDPGASELVATLRADGARTALVSGGFTCFAEPIAQQLGFDDAQANILEVTGGQLTGRVIEPILDRDAKVQALERHCAELGLSPADAVAVGDGANDLGMLCHAGLGVAYHGKPKVAAAAPFRVDHGDLSTLLAFLGYRRGERST